MANTDILSRFDAYSLNARLRPALIVGIPLALTIGILLPGVDWWTAGLASIGSAVGLTFLLAQMGRDMGKRKEPGLFRSWGGKPTTRILRHRDTWIDRHTLARYHRNIQRLAPELNIPLPEEEQADPTGADQVYEAAIHMLISKTRDRKRFHLVFTENVNFGFRRNLWGMKPLAIALLLVALGVCAWALCGDHNAHRPLQPLVIGAAILVAALFLLWNTWFTPGWVRIPAEAYAERLLEASDKLVASLQDTGPGAD